MNPAKKRAPKTFGKVSTVPAGKFKTHCLKLMDEVKNRHCEIVITKHGTPVAKLVPIDEQRPDIFGYAKGSIVILGDIVGPSDEIWDADR